MSLESDFYSALVGHSALTALVGQYIVPSHMAEESPAAYVVYNAITDEARYSLDGPEGLSKVRMQADCYAEDPDSAAAISRAVIAAVPTTGWPLHRTGHSNRDLGLEAGTGRYRRMVEFDLFHKPS